MGRPAAVGLVVLRSCAPSGFRQLLSFHVREPAAPLGFALVQPRGAFGPAGVGRLSCRRRILAAATWRILRLWRAQSLRVWERTFNLGCGWQP
jgi:hypothetical protein